MRGLRRISWMPLAAGAALCLSLWGAPARAAETLARYAPADKLIVLFEFDGLEAHRDAWEKTAAWRAFHETKLGDLVRDLAGQAFDLVKKANPDRKVGPASKAELESWINHVKDHGFLFAFFGRDPNPLGLFVIRGAAQGEPSRVVAALRGTDDLSETKLVEKAGRSIHVSGYGSAWWVEGDDLVIAETKGLDEIFAALDGKKPSAADSPIRTALAESRDGFEPVAIGLFDFTQLGPLAPEALKLGLDGAKRAEFQWGFREDALESFARLVAPAPRRGILSLLDQPTFDIGSLPPIPAGQTSFNVLSIDALKTYERIVGLLKETDPEQARAAAEAEKRVRDELGLDPRSDFLKLLGPQIALYGLPVEAPVRFGLPNQMDRTFSTAAGLVISVQTPDDKALAKSLEPIIELINKQVAKDMKDAPKPLKLVKSDGPGVEYTMSLAGLGLPPFLEQAFLPTIAVGNGQLVFSPSRDAARKALATAAEAPAERWRATEKFVPLVERLPKGMIGLSIFDIRESLPEIIEGLPQTVAMFNAQGAPAIKQQGGPDISFHVDPDQVPSADQIRALLFPNSYALAVDDQGLTYHSRESLPSVSSPATAGVLMGLMIPAVQSAREAARRAQCVNQLKQIGLALHNYHDMHGHFPGNITDKDGKPLLSWRVAILPLVDQEELYKEFKLDEPWDSPHNKPLMDRIPSFLHCPSHSRLDPTLTNYQGFEGTRAFFERGAKVTLASFTDGTSNTIAVVEAEEGTPWTKPSDLPFDETAPPSLYGAGSKHAGGFNVLFADGSVRFLQLTINPTVLRALITRAGGEVVSSDSF